MKRNLVRAGDFGDLRAKPADSYDVTLLTGRHAAQRAEPLPCPLIREDLHHRRLLRRAGRIALPVAQLHGIAGEIVQLEFVGHQGTLDRDLGARAGTINHGLKIVRRIMNLAATEWMDEFGLTWLAVAPKIRLLPDTEKRLPYPLSWDEQTQLVRELPEHLASMTLFAVNTGCRDSEVCGLRWDWEVRVPALGTSVFIIPGRHVKNGDKRLVA